MSSAILVRSIEHHIEDPAMQQQDNSRDTEPDQDIVTDQPGLGRLRSAVANHLGPKLPGLASLRRDGLAGLTGAVSNVPDGMANGVLVGVNPVYGLYAAMMGPLVGGAFSSTQLMMITTTAAASISTSQALGGLSGEARAGALAVLVLLVGLFQVLFGVLNFGKLIRFVSYSVTTGFLSGVSVLLILNQIPVVTGHDTDAGRLGVLVELLRDPQLIDLPSLALAAAALALAVLLPRTPLGNFGRLVAVVVPSLAVVVLGLGSVEIVRDVGEIPQGLPRPSLPPLSAVSFDLVTGALAVAIVILVQGAGVSQSVANPDKTRSNASRDFVAQGAANIASGLVRGLPVGGSHSATALNVIYGAQTRWAAILAGLWMAGVVTLFPDLVSYIAMPALGALLVLAGATSLEPRDMRLIWRTGWTSRIAGGATFLAALFLSVQLAIAIGVLLSALLYVGRSSTDVSVVRLVKGRDGRIEEREPPDRLPSDEVTVLDVYGHLFYAGARTLEHLLPNVQGARRPAVVLRLRGLSVVGATLLDVLARYADELEAAGGRLYLAGVSSRVHDQVVRTGKLHLSGPVRVHDATAIRGDSTHDAVTEARTWLVGGSPASKDLPSDAGDSDQTTSTFREPEP